MRGAGGEGVHTPNLGGEEADGEGGGDIDLDVVGVVDVVAVMDGEGDGDAGRAGQLLDRMAAEAAASSGDMTMTPFC